MNLKLLGIFVKGLNGSGELTPEIRRNCGKAAGVIGIVSNLLLSVLKVVIGIACHSIAITADAVNNISDAGSSVITLIGFKMSEKPADDKHPYGHARIEYLSGFIVSLVITALGAQFFKDSVKAIILPSDSGYSTASFIVLALAIGIKLWQAGFYKGVGGYIKSPSLIATAADSRNDVFTTAAVLIGAIISRLTDINLDGWLGLLVAAFIIYSGIRLIIETADPILGVAPDEQFVKEISDKILSYDGILGIHDLIIHNYGEGKCFVSVHCEVSADENIMKSHDIIDNIEFDFLRERNIHLVIHMDPIITNDVHINALRAQTMEIINRVSSELEIAMSMHDFRVVAGETHTNLIFDILLPGSARSDTGLICEMIKSELKKLSPTYNAVINVDINYSTISDK